MQYYAATFLAGFSLMVVEITSSRIIAPIIGSSIYTWTSVIGVTLLGLTVGSFGGGELADRCSKKNQKKIVAMAFLSAAFFVYAILTLSRHISVVLNQNSLLVLSVTVSMTLFLLPAIAIGTLAPIIFKAYVDSVNDVGKKYGLFSGLWSLGSIAGVFFTGFYFIPTIGSANTIFLISGLLVFAFYFFYLQGIERGSSDFEHQVVILILVSACLTALIVHSVLKPTMIPAAVLFQKETAYYDVQVLDYDLYPQYGQNRILFLDIDSHSVHTEKSSKMFYTDIAPAFSVFTKKLDNIYVIGAGAYTLPINMRTFYPNASITVGEIDPELQNVGRKYFNLDDYNITTEIGDARILFADNHSNQSKKYDLIYGDAYNSFISVPWYLLTREFTTQVKKALMPGGIYAVNFIGALEGPNASMFESIYSTVHSVFPTVYLFSFGKKPTDLQNITIFGVFSDNALSYADTVEKLNAIDPAHFLSQVLRDKDSLNQHSGIKNGLILSDDYSPIEYMMTGLMNEYFPKYIALYDKIAK